MLPLSPPELQLSQDSQNRLDAFFTRFCRGHNGHLYKIGHIVYACHAAFPLVISPGLANLTWLNFNSYKFKGGMQKIDPIAVNDFLFSELVRPTGSRQFEVIPDIRNYLLYLLKDETWFNYYGAVNFGALRLSQLAQFLLQYLGEKIFPDEKNIGNARQLNELAAIAYLSPSLLTSRLAGTLKNAVSQDDTHETTQLRINAIIEQFGMQFSAGLFEADEGGINSFSSLRLYSSGNRARLFDEPPNEVSDLFYNIDDSFIIPDQVEDIIGLPVLPAVSERLLRKKEKRQRIWSLLVDTTDYETSRDIGRLKIYLRNINKNFGLDVLPAKVCEGKEATWINVREQLSSIVNEANHEDILLLFYRSNQEHNTDTLSFQGINSASEKEIVSQKTFINFLSEIRSKKILQIVFVVDQPSNPGTLYVGRTDVQLSWSLKAKGYHDRTFYQVLYSYLINIRLPVSYGDLAKILQAFVEGENNGGIPEIRIALHCLSHVAEYFFLTHRPKSLRENRQLLVYNRAIDNWSVTSRDFVEVTKYRPMTVFQYDSTEIVKSAFGEVSDKSGKLLFAGRTDRLNKNIVYEIRPELPSLDVYTEEIDTNFSKLVNLITPDPYSNFSGFKTYLPIDNKDRYNLPGLHIRKHVKEYNGIDIVFNLKGNNVGAFKQLKFDNISEADLPVFFKRITRFEYVYNLQPPGPGWENISVGTTFSWVGDNTTRQFSSTGNFSLGKEAFTINDGRIAICLIGFEAESFERIPVYLEIYILTSTLQIKRLTNQFTILKATSQLELFFDEKELISELLLNEQFAVFKVLLSYDPITIDFTQDGCRPESIQNHGKRR